MGISLRPFRRSLIAAAVLAGLPIQLHAADRYWIGATGTWQTGTWSATPGGTLAASAPVSGDNAFILSSNSLTVFRDASSGSISSGTVQIDGTGAGIVTLDKSSTTTFGATNLLTGVNGRGIFNTSGGSVSGTNVVVGSQFGSIGSVTSSNTSWQVGSMTIGSSGLGSFQQTGGGMFYSNTITLGAGTTGYGLYALNSGTIGSAAVQFIVGGSGYGQFDINAGTANLSALTLGSQSGAVGQLNLYAGSLNTGGATRLGEITGSGVGHVYLYSGTASFATLTVNPNSSFYNAGAILSVSNAIVVAGGSVEFGATPLVLTSARTLAVTDGYFGAANITTSIGSVNFNSGTLALTASDFNPALNPILGSGSISLPATRTLIVSGTTTLSSANPVVISGGTFSTGSLTGNLAALQFNSGTFKLTTWDLEFGGTGIFGSTYVIDSSKRIATENGRSVTIDIDSQVYINGGALNASGAIYNYSLLQLASPTSRATGQLVNYGLVSGTGRLGTLSNEFGGEVRIGATDQLIFGNFPHYNIGLINLLGGVADFTGGITNVGRITGRGTLRSAQFDNIGSIALSAGITDVYGDVHNFVGSSIIVSGNANVTFWDDVTNDNFAVIKVSPGSVASFFGSYGGTGITGGGSVNFESDITPGFSPAAISVAGNVRFGSDAKLRIELGGTNRGTQYDAIDITGSATLDGQLRVSTLNGFTPLPGMSFDILSFASRSDQFELVNDTGYPGLHITPIYLANSLQLQTSGIDGDANLDGKVDLRDLYILASHFKQSGQNWLGADFNSDGLTNSFDLGLLAHNWQVGVGSPNGVPLDGLLASLGLPIVNVPEPSALLYATGAVLLMRRIRKSV